jgi:hypothetical protein
MTATHDETGNGHIVLTPEESERFAALSESLALPNKALQDAMERFRAHASRANYERKLEI